LGENIEEKGKEKKVLSVLWGKGGGGGEESLTLLGKATGKANFITFSHTKKREGGGGGRISGCGRGRNKFEERYLEQ